MQPANDTGVARIADLRIHPIKGCGALSVPEVALDRRGPVLDRRWVVVDAGTGRFVTQRERRALASVRVEVGEAAIRCLAPGRAEALTLPRPDVSPPPPDAPWVRVRVWRDECVGVDVGDEGAAWFSDVLGAAVRILVQPPDGVGWGRDAPALRVGPDGRESRTGYADAGPLLVTNAASLADLNRRRAPLPPLPMGRFRPNVVVEGPPAWAEDGWATLEVEGGVVIDLGKPCPRCAVINTDQETGGFDPEPLNALAAFRTVRPDGGDDCCPTGVMFGLNAAHRAPGVLRVGATVRSHGKGSGARTFSR